MKKFCSVIFLPVLIVILLVGCEKSLYDCEKSSSDWLEYKIDKDGNYFYYKKVSINKDGDNYLVQVWDKMVYSDKGRKKEIQWRTKDGLSNEGYDKLSYKKCLYEIDCKKQSISVLSIIHYDTEGKELYSGGDTSERKWFDIQPNSTSDTLRTNVCK